MQGKIFIWAGPPHSYSYINHTLLRTYQRFFISCVLTVIRSLRLLSLYWSIEQPAVELEKSNSYSSSSVLVLLVLYHLVSRGTYNAVCWWFDLEFGLRERITHTKKRFLGHVSSFANPPPLGWANFFFFENTPPKIEMSHLFFLFF